MIEARCFRQPTEDRRQGPGLRIDLRRQAVGQHARDVFQKSAAGDMGQGLDLAGGGCREAALYIKPSGREQRLGHGLTRREGGGIGPAELRLFHNPPHQRETIGMNARGSETQDDIALGDRAAVDPLAALHGAHREAGQIVVARGIHARHFGGLAADQGAAYFLTGLSDAGDDGAARRHIELSGREIVEEEEGFGALDHQIVDAHGHQIDADALMAAAGDGNFELGAHPVGGGNQDRIFEARRLQVEKRAKAAESCVGALARGRFGEWLDRVDKRVARIDIDAGRTVGVAGIGARYGVLARSRLRPQGEGRHSAVEVEAKILDPAWFATMLKRLGSLLALALLLLAAAAPARAAEVFTVENVPLDATAASVTAAREAARVEGQRRALRMLFERLTLSSDRSRLPRVSDNALSDMIQGFEVAGERSSAVRYLAQYTYRFNPEAVRKLLRDANVPFAETQSKPVVVVAVWRDSERPILWDEPNPWRAAWGTKPLSQGLVPIVLPRGDINDATAIDAEGALNGDDGALRALAGRYKAGDTLVAQATMSGTGDARVLELQSEREGSGGGNQSWTAQIKAQPGESDGDFLQRAAVATLDRLEDAWKQSNLLRFGQAGTMTVSVPVTDLKDWLSIRERLTGVAEIRGTDVLSLDRSMVRLTLRYLGEPTQLRLALAQRDLDLVEGAPDWTLTRRPAR